MAELPRYLFLSSQADKLSDITNEHFKAIIVSDLPIPPIRRQATAEWLIDNGCKYALTWGVDCESWHDDIDFAFIDKHLETEATANDFVMTTWHPDEKLEDVFWQTKNTVEHPTLKLSETIILHFGKYSQKTAMINAYLAS